MQDASHGLNELISCRNVTFIVNSSKKHSHNLKKNDPVVYGLTQDMNSLRCQISIIQALIKNLSIDSLPA